MAIVPMKKDDPDVLRAGQGLVLADFYADWCGPCKSMAEVLREYVREEPDTVICAVNVDERKKMAEEFGVMSIPTLLFFYDGQVVSRLVGLQSRRQIRREVEKYRQGRPAEQNR